VDQTEALIIETIDRHREEILEFARDIYSHAELGYKEFQTSGKFVKKMEQLGLRTEKGFAITGVKAYLNEDKKKCKSCTAGRTGCTPYPGACLCKS
jgi:Metal-dependent amidase/aminoacylase/carboxypeptidase